MSTEDRQVRAAVKNATEQDRDMLYADKAHEVIGALCYAAWDKANPKHPRRGRPKKHRPYAVPELAQRLATALGLHDMGAREREVKALLLEHNYLALVGGT